MATITTLIFPLPALSSLFFSPGSSPRTCGSDDAVAEQTGRVDGEGLSGEQVSHLATELHPH